MALRDGVERVTDYNANTNLIRKVLDFIQFGGAGGTRTPYLFNAIEALSRLSYSPMPSLNGRRGGSCATPTR